MVQYHEVADRTMDNLLETLELLVDTDETPSYEVEYHSGVLTLNLGTHGTYVINKQPPNKQIWLSSPLSGPKRYDYLEDDNQWIYARDGRTLNGLLSEELSKVFGRTIDITLL
ncbi:hypothetical protein B0H34DRAFT_792950 [Crassisporium funariophilum]|nr:hypothetical protein B0H34DRAFT_792950 [Crassisporium funariophilum]